MVQGVMEREDKLDRVRKTIADARGASIVVNKSCPATTTLKDRESENAKRVALYRKLDASRAELDSLILKDAAGSAGSEQHTAEAKGLRREVEDLAAKLVIQPVQSQPWTVVSIIDFFVRAPACFLFVLFLAFVTSVPLILLTMVENQFLFMLQRRRRRRSSRQDAKGSITTSPGQQIATRSSNISPSTSVRPAEEAARPAVGRDSGSDATAGAGRGNASLSSLIKRFDAWWVLLIMGVSVEVQGLRECRLRRLGNPVVLLFSHVSTLDAMIILSTFPEAFCAVVKEELFALPIIGWIMASHGGVPINRRHRASAVQALAETGERARELGLHVAMAPEGTRSKTGQLGPFKKGALHMQEQLHWPVIPVTIRGAYELFPLKWFFNQCGKVMVRYHQPIPASEVKSREHLARTLRQEMLQAAAEEAPGAGGPLTPSRRLMSFVACSLTYSMAARWWRSIVTFSRREGVDLWVLVAGGLAYVALSTIFVYFVYARRCFRSSGASGRGGVAGGTHAGAAEAPARCGGERSLDNGAGSLKSERGAGEGEAEHLLGGGEGGGASAPSPTER